VSVKQTIQYYKYITNNYCIACTTMFKTSWRKFEHGIEAHTREIWISNLSGLVKTNQKMKLDIREIN